MQASCSQPALIAGLAGLLPATSLPMIKTAIGSKFMRRPSVAAKTLPRGLVSAFSLLCSPSFPEVLDATGFDQASGAGRRTACASHALLRRLSRRFGTASTDGVYERHTRLIITRSNSDLISSAMKASLSAPQVSHHNLNHSDHSESI